MTAFPTTVPDALPLWELPDSKGSLKKSFTKATAPAFSGIRATISPFSETAKEMGIPNAIVKIVKGLGHLFATLTNDASAKNFVSHCTTFSDAVKVFNFSKGVDDILLNAGKTNLTGVKLHQRNLGIASGFFQTLISGMAGTKLLSTFQVLSIADISAALGTTTVLPFSVVASGAEIVKSVLDIANGSLRIYETNQKKEKIKNKYNQFKVTATAANIGTFLTNHLAAIDQKQKAAEAELAGALKTNLDNTQKTAEDAYSAYQGVVDEINALDDPGPDATKISVFFNKFKLTLDKNEKKAALFEAKLAHDQAFEKYTRKRASFAARVGKYERWKGILEHFTTNGSQVKKDDQDNVVADDPLNLLLAHKKMRWKAQRANCKSDNLKDGIGIAISVVATIALIASIIFTFSGIGTIPVLLTMTSIWLLIAVAGLTSGLLKKYSKPLAVPVTNFKSQNFN